MFMVSQIYHNNMVNLQAPSFLCYQNIVERNLCRSKSSYAFLQVRGLIAAHFFLSRQNYDYGGKENEKV